MVSDSNITYLQVQPHILCKNAAGGADSAWTVCAILQNSAGRAVWKWMLPAASPAQRRPSKIKAATREAMSASVMIRCSASLFRGSEGAAVTRTRAAGAFMQVLHRKWKWVFTDWKREGADRRARANFFFPQLSSSLTISPDKKNVIFFCQGWSEKEKCFLLVNQIRACEGSHSGNATGGNP